MIHLMWNFVPGQFAITVNKDLPLQVNPFTTIKLCIVTSCIFGINLSMIELYIVLDRYYLCLCRRDPRPGVF